jgi:hypothetical protein
VAILENVGLIPKQQQQQADGQQQPAKQLVAA